MLIVFAGLFNLFIALLAAIGSRRAVLKKGSWSFSLLHAPQHQNMSVVLQALLHNDHNTLCQLWSREWTTARRADLLAQESSNSTSHVFAKLQLTKKLELEILVAEHFNCNGASKLFFASLLGVTCTSIELNGLICRMLKATRRFRKHCRISQLPYDLWF